MAREPGQGPLFKFEACSHGQMPPSATLGTSSGFHRRPVSERPCPIGGISAAIRGISKRPKLVLDSSSNYWSENEL
jgi:hypothetical protein